MVRDDFKGDFTGFKFGGVHSSELGIARVSGGDRYEDQLHPEIKDKTAEVSGVNGNYYFGSDYGTKTFSLNIAYDSLTEDEFRRLRQVFGTKQIQELIFDECPYKIYMAKLESPIELSYVCFDAPKKTVGETRDGVRVINRIQSGDTTILEYEPVNPININYTQRERIYKGEGTISLICYFPFAKSAFKQISQEDEESGWAFSSGIMTSSQYSSEHIDEYLNGEITIYNPGDVATGFKLYIPNTALNSNITLVYQNALGERTASLVLKPITLLSNSETGIMIDTTAGLITGAILNNSIYTTTNNIYNGAITAGYFFHLEPNIRDTTAEIDIENGVSGIKIFYDYLYF